MYSTRANHRYLDALFCAAPQDTFVELRHRATRGMICTFWPVRHLPAIPREIAKRATHGDVYVGVLPRQHRASTRDAVLDEASVLWVDCDSPQSVQALADFAPQPSILVASGTDDNRHGYWLLRDSSPLDDIERANRRLAQQLGGDLQCTDAARILRPPSLNHKHAPPTPVRLINCDPLRRWYLDEIVDVAHAVRVSPPRSIEPGRANDDELLRLDAAYYVERLAGLDIGRDRKIACPFHDDRTPSLHVYREPTRGWYCFGCGRGGSAYDFGAALWGYATRGGDFLALRDRLIEALDL